VSLTEKLVPWVKYLKAAGWLAVFGFFFWIGGVREERSWLAKENSGLKKAMNDVRAANKERLEAQAKADKLASLPAKVVTVVRANPSGCSLAPPVAGAIRDQVKAVNDAIR
jgi:hypothetical protein